MKENGQQQAAEFGQRVKEIRKTLGLSQKDFADPLGISGTFISEVESGKYKPCYDFFYNMMVQFNVNLHYLFTGQGEMFIRDMKPAESEIEEPFSSITKTEDILWYMTRSPMFKHSMFGFASRYLYENRTFVELEIAAYKTKKSGEKNKSK
ncbi:MAG: repressor LexA [Acidobacteriota bacterium]|nr:repressor LexA [Acidobacteriota bacterium]